MTSELKLGIIGCGRVVQDIHLPTLRRIRGASVVALADIDRQRREEARRRQPGATIVASYEELLDLPELDAVLVCLPSALQAAAATAAFRSGRHAYVEK